MPDPIQSFSNISWYPEADDASPQENAAQLCSTSLHGPQPEPAPAVPSTVPGTLAAASPPATGTAALVAQFVPLKEHPVPEPSVLKATWACAGELANVALTTAVVLGSAPETFGASLLGVGRIVMTGRAFDKCATQDEAKQVQAQVNAAAAQECEAQGGIALLTVSGSPVCLVSK